MWDERRLAQLQRTGESWAHVAVLVLALLLSAHVAVLVLALLLSAGTSHAAQTYVGVTEGADKKVSGESRTQGADTVIDEVVNSAYSTSTTKVEGNKTATGSSAAILGSTTPCHSMVIYADPANVGPVWIRRQSGATTANSFPLFPGDRQQFAADNNRECANFFVIQGTGCSADCVLYYFTN